MRGTGGGIPCSGVALYPPKHTRDHSVADAGVLDALVWVTGRRVRNPRDLDARAVVKAC